MKQPIIDTDTLSYFFVIILSSFLNWIRIYKNMAA